MGACCFGKETFMVVKSPFLGVSCTFPVFGAVIVGKSLSLQKLTKGNCFSAVSNQEKANIQELKTDH
jgi:hypothetical protein